LPLPPTASEAGIAGCRRPSGVTPKSGRFADPFISSLDKQNARAGRGHHAEAEKKEIAPARA
jgi:hypothetical protein